MSEQTLRLGVVGMGRAFTLMLPTFLNDGRIEMVGAADPVAAARRQFESDFNAPSYESVEALCARPEVQAVYIASPHQLHAEHVSIAASCGKHVLVEKPMALTLEACTHMLDVTRRAGVYLVVGHSHSFNTPIQHARQLIDSGQFGAVRMITALNFTDFLYRPRRPEELDTRFGGGVIHSQAAHQIDIVRLLGGGLVRSVRAHTGAWDPSRPTEGAYSTLLGFEGGAFASATYSGYGHFDSDVWMEHTSEMGYLKSQHDYGGARKRLLTVTSSEDESRLKAERNYGGDLYQPAANTSPPTAHSHFGPLIISCEKADLRPTPTGIGIYTDARQLHETLPTHSIPRKEVIDELFAAVMNDVAPLHSGEWARATTAVCLAILESSRLGHDCVPAWQVNHHP